MASDVNEGARLEFTYLPTRNAVILFCSSVPVVIAISMA
jgi:hypothetical protein